MTDFTSEKIYADQVTEGDYLPKALDNGYVIDVEVEEFALPSGPRGPYVNLGVMAVITFNTSDGEEGYLILPPATEIEVRREVGDTVERESKGDED